LKIGDWRLATIRGLIGVITIILASAACSTGSPDPYVVHAERSPDGKRVAVVRLAPCGDNWCESLWVGPSQQQVTQVATLASGIEHCTEIAWRPDSARVGFLIDGVQLRLYDAERHSPAGLADLVPKDGPPTTRIARGVTFSDNGVAVTFDDCPRDRSGCRPGMIAIR
jgi:hypothetical protein